MGYNPSTFKGDQRQRKAEKLPVETVSWNEAIAFCNKLNQMLGLPDAYDRDGQIINFTSYRLPTEAEWEFAARGGKKSKGYKYSGSNNHGEVAWYEGNSGSTSQIIGSKKANELGIHDLSGNVLEWVSDWYDSSYYNRSAKKNPYNVFSGLNRVDRGGSWIDDLGNLRVSFRDSGSPGSRYSLLGFRLARSLPEKNKKRN